MNLTMFFCGSCNVSEIPVLSLFKSQVLDLMSEKKMPLGVSINDVVQFLTPFPPLSRLLVLRLMNCRQIVLGPFRFKP